MNKLIVYVSLMVLGAASIFSFNQLRGIKAMQTKLTQQKNELLMRETQINDLAKLADKPLPEVTRVLWQMNNTVNNHQHQYNQKTKFQSLESSSKGIIDITNSHIAQQDWMVSFYDLRSAEDVLRVLKFLDKWQHQFPIKIYQLEGFKDYVHVKGVLVALKEVQL